MSKIESKRVPKSGAVVPTPRTPTHEERMRLINAPFPVIFIESPRRYGNALGRRKPGMDWQEIHNNDKDNR